MLHAPRAGFFTSKLRYGPLKGWDVASDNHADEVSKPLPGGSFEACVRRFEDDPEVDDPEALCGWLEENKDSEVVSAWDPEDGLEDLLDALNDPQAEKVLQNLEVTYVSGVENPAQDSQWVMAKDADDRGADWGVSAPLVLKEEPPMPEDAEGEGGEAVDEEQKAWAPVLIPNETDKQGDVIPVGGIEQAAHTFLANYRKVDTDHDLMEGKGTPIESWTLKQDTTFTLPNGDGETREYPAGTWMLGVRFNDEAWERVKTGELQGFSIYGEAENTPVEEILGLANGEAVERSAGSPVALAKSANEVHETVKNTNQIMTDNDTEDGEGGEANETEATLESIKSTVEDNNTLAKETREDVNDLQKSHESLAERVDELEEDLEAVKSGEAGENGDEETETEAGEETGKDEGEGDEDALTEEDLEEAKEELAEDLKEETEESAAKAAEEAVKSLLGVEDEDLPEEADERREVLRKGLMEPGEDGTDGSGTIGFTADDINNAVHGGN